MILLRMNRSDYENDIRALLMSFFFGEKVFGESQLERQRADKGGADIVFTALYDEDALELSVEGKGRECRGRFERGAESEKKERDFVKDSVYSLLSRFTGQKLPWGTLTGVRPSKIAMEVLEDGGDERKAADHMMGKYLVSREKAELASAVASRELSILSSLREELYKEDKSPATLDPKTPLPGYSLYLGIPFCPSICAYCSFSSYPIAQWGERTWEYIEALEKEIDFVSDMSVKPLTFYMGGGTPTSISAGELDRVLGRLQEKIDFSRCLETCVEAGRPDSISAEKLRVLKKRGINRISVNPQSMNEKTLAVIGRKHSPQDIERAFHIAREEGFDNINMDLIAGLPGEDAGDMERSLEKVMALMPDSITIHSLALKRAAYLNQNREEFPVAGPEEILKMVRMSHEYCSRAGLKPYYLYRQKNIAGNMENTAYAREGRESLYNMIIMEELQSILAIGAGAISKRVYPGHRIVRSANVKSVEDYIARVDEMIQRKQEMMTC